MNRINKRWVSQLNLLLLLLPKNHREKIVKACQKTSRRVPALWSCCPIPLPASQLEISNVALLKSTHNFYAFFAILKLVFRHETRRQMSAHFKTYQTVIQSTSMADFTFGFTKGSFLLLNGQKHLMPAAEDLTSNKQKRTKWICQKLRWHWYYKTLKPIFLNRS